MGASDGEPDRRAFRAAFAIVAMSEAWFADVEPDDPGAGVAAIRDGRADAPADWPALAVEAGFADDSGEYYARLRAAAIEAARTAAAERERADDRQAIHAVRAMDDAERTANELAERVAEWGASRYDESGTGVEYCRELVRQADPGGAAAEEPDASATAPTADGTPPTADGALAGLAARVVELDAEADRLRAFVEHTVGAVAPNLAALAGPVLGARLLALAGSLESLAKKPSGTIQVLGAEEALFAHLREAAPSPKHGIVYTHEYVRSTRPEERGSAARALAGKLAIAARIDHYAGDRRPALERELDERIARIRARGDSSGEGTGATGGPESNGNDEGDGDDSGDRPADGRPPGDG